MSNSRIKFLTLFCLLLTATSAFAQQPKDNSPYSRFGLGDLQPQTNAALNGMGGLSTAYHNPFRLNFDNPASYSFLREAAFDVGLFAKYANLESGETSAQVYSGNISSLALGFPIQNPENLLRDRKDPLLRWGMAIGLQPYTTVGYDITAQDEINNIETVTYDYQGSGGTYKLTWGNSLRYKNFSAGLNLSYLFGKMIYERKVLFSDLDAAFNDDFLDEISVNTVLTKFGFQYHHQFESVNTKGDLEKDGRFITAGLTFNPAHSFDTEKSSLYRRGRDPFSSTSYVEEDTLVFPQDIIEGTGRLPLEFGFGIMFGKEAIRVQSQGQKNIWSVGLNFTSSKWSEYSNDAKPERLLNSWRAAVGGQYLKDRYSLKYRQRVTYRLGAFYESDAREVLGTQLTKYGMTVGMGLPLIMPNRRNSFVDFALELGQFGVSESLQENYIRLNVGFTLNDNGWFFKRRFN